MRLNLATPTRPHIWVDRFWKHVHKTEDCWEWTSRLTKKGYGRFAVSQKRLAAHRASWFLHYGPIPEGMFVCHHCDNPKCIRPDHLFLGTHRDNMRDMARKGRAIKGRKGPPRWGQGNPNAKLTEADVLQIRRAYKNGGVTQCSLGTLYGVHRTAISDILIGRTWAHSEGMVAE